VSGEECERFDALQEFTYGMADGIAFFIARTWQALQSNQQPLRIPTHCYGT